MRYRLREKAIPWGAGFEVDGESLDGAHGSAGQAGADADAGHTEFLQPADGRRCRRSEHIDRESQGHDECADGFFVRDAGDENTIRSRIDVSARAGGGLLEARVGIAFLIEVKICASVDDEVNAEFASNPADGGNA